MPLDSPAVLLSIYCIVALFATLMGGMLPTLLHLTHTRLQMAVSFVGGLMLGLSLLGMVPHALGQLKSIQSTAAWVLCGFVVMFLLQRFLPFHHHDVPEGSPVESCGHSHSPAELSSSGLNWVGVALGLSLHSIFDGVAMAAAVSAGHQADHEALGLGTALAVILHKPFGAMAITTLMVASHSSRNALRWVNLGFALVTPIAALLFFVGAGQFSGLDSQWIGQALAFCAGTFLCIATSDLLPELQFHKHDRVKLTVALVVGLATAVAMTQLGHPDHGSHEAPGAAESHPAAESGHEH